MSDETLQQLLQRADAATAERAPTPSAAALLAAVRSRRRRNAGLRAVATTAVLAAAGVSSRHMFDRSPNSGTDWSLKRPVQSADADALRRNFAQLEQQANLHLQIVRGLTEQPTESEPPLADADLLRLEAARSAAISWQYATLVETEMADPATARREYERVAERFPGTEWANLAAESLKRLSEPKNPSSL